MTCKQNENEIGGRIKLVLKVYSMPIISVLDMKNGVPASVHFYNKRTEPPGYGVLANRGIGYHFPGNKRSFLELYLLCTIPFRWSQ